MTKRRSVRWGWILVPLALIGCEDKKSTPEPIKPPPEQPKPALTQTKVAPTASQANSLKPTTVLNIQAKGNNMAFVETKLTVKSGEIVRLVFKNPATLAVMKHNWVLTKPGKGQEVGEKGTAAGEDAGYFAPSPDILAHTPIAQPGETVEVVFKAPPPGTYPYVCTVLGHYVVMKGELVVE